jgi:hypothetical protein
MAGEIWRLTQTIGYYQTHDEAAAAAPDDTDWTATPPAGRPDLAGERYGLGPAGARHLLSQDVAAETPTGKPAVRLSEIVSYNRSFAEVKTACPGYSWDPTADQLASYDGYAPAEYHAGDQTGRRFIARRVDI